MPRIYTGLKGTAYRVLHPRKKRLTEAYIGDCSHCGTHNAKIVHWTMQHRDDGPEPVVFVLCVNVTCGATVSLWRR